MKVDVVEQLGAVTRKVESRTRDGLTMRVVIAARRYDTTIDDLWDAMTNAERIPRWFLPVSGDLELGGRYQLEGNAGGRITACEPPSHLAVTWEFGELMSWVDVRLTAHPDGGTELVLEHEAPDSPHWTEYGPGAGGVEWDLSLLGLAEHLATRAQVDRDAWDAWMTTEVGRALMAESSTSWGEAAIASGTDPETARAAAHRTTAFYTGSEA